MITKLSIKNFKSVKDLTLNECKRISVFIGEPNTGKSNILESLGMLSYSGYSRYSHLKEFVRMEEPSSVFYDREINTPVTISFDHQELSVRNVETYFQATYKDSDVWKFDRGGGGSSHILEEATAFKFYRFRSDVEFQQTDVNQFLLPPFGRNLIEVIITHRELRNLVSELFRRSDIRLVARAHENRLEVQKEREGFVIAFPYSAVSDTLRRLVFHIAAIKSVQDSVVVFEEPEAHAFPSYTRHLGELIAADRSNQYFITTHDPYFLLALVEKAPKRDTSVYLTYYDDAQTKVKTVPHEEVMALESDVFFNFDKLLAGLPSALR